MRRLYFFHLLILILVPATWRFPQKEETSKDRRVRRSFEMTSVDVPVPLPHWDVHVPFWVTSMASSSILVISDVIFEVTGWGHRLVGAGGAVNSFSHRDPMVKES